MTVDALFLDDMFIYTCMWLYDCMWTPLHTNMSLSMETWMDIARPIKHPSLGCFSWHCIIRSCHTNPHQSPMFLGCAFRICHLFFRACFHCSLRRVSAGAEQILVFYEVQMMSFHIGLRSSWPGSHMKFQTFVLVSRAAVGVCSEVHIQCFHSEHESSPHHPPSLYRNSQAWHEWPHGWPDASAVGWSLCLGTKASMVRHLPLRKQFPKKGTETRETSGNTKLLEPTYSVLLW